jgi:glycosyltransferase involved in cell wall biosynthesis
METIHSEDLKKILIVGPLPPPIGGSPLTAKAMIDELARYQSIQVEVINTSPLRDVRKDMTGFKFEKVRRMIYILTRYFRKLHTWDVILVFANDLFAFILVPILLSAARIFHKPFYIKPVGSGLDLYLAGQNKLLRKYFLNVLRSADGILAQTQLLQSALIKMGCTNAYYLPGCRTRLPIIQSKNGKSDEVHLIFLGHITRNKGPLVLLESLQILAQQCDVKVSCDFYGPIHEDVQADFLRQMDVTHNAHYRGMAEAGSGTQLISEYDALILPTYYDTEGHPGVIIEAMHAGIPVITTQVRTLPELINHGENGFLVPLQDSQALAEAIKQIAVDRPLRERMGKANYRKGNEFCSDVVVAKMLKIMLGN